MIGPVKSKQRSTLLLGSYGRGNLGDDAFLIAAAELFTDRKLYINSANEDLLPESIRSSVGTISTTSTLDILKKIKVFFEVDDIIYWGGDVWVKLYDDRFPRQSLYKMILLNVLTRMSGKGVYYIGCGIGKLQGYSLWLARLSARLANMVILREERSASLLNIRKSTVAADLAVSLPYYSPRTHSLPKKGKPFVIGISILYHLPEPQKNFTRFVQHICIFIASLPPGEFEVVLLPMLMSKYEKRDDLWASQQVQARLKEVGLTCDIYESSSVSDLIKKLDSLDLMIGTRLHANILAAFNATPCLGIAYRPKVRSFFRDNDVVEHCVDLDSLRDLPSHFWNIYQHYDEVAGQFSLVSHTNLEKRVAYQEFAQKYE